MSPKTKNSAAGSTRSTRAGLIFPVGRVHKHLKSGKYGKRISPNSAVFLAASLEYITAEVLELAGGQAKNEKRSRIMPKHIGAAVQTDTELKSLLGDVFIEGGTLNITLDRRALPTRAQQSMQRREKKRLAEAREVVADAEVVVAAVPKKKKKKKVAAPVPKKKAAPKKKAVVEEEFVSAEEKGDDAMDLDNDDVSGEISSSFDL